jgi:hypothetical protein
MGKKLKFLNKFKLSKRDAKKLSMVEFHALHLMPMFRGKNRSFS